MKYLPLFFFQKKCEWNFTPEYGWRNFAFPLMQRRTNYFEIP